MKNLRLLGVSSVFFAGLWLFACSSDETEPNPSFTVGEGGSPTEPEPGEAGAPTTPGGGGQGTSGTAGSSTGATSSAGSPPEPMAGAAGAGGEVPPYDCVLHPTTHVEIINACTDAVRIEKHPSLPALPQ